MMVVNEWILEVAVTSDESSLGSGRVGDGEKVGCVKV